MAARIGAPTARIGAPTARIAPPAPAPINPPVVPVAQLSRHQPDRQTPGERMIPAPIGAPSASISNKPTAANVSSAAGADARSQPGSSSTCPGSSSSAVAPRLANDVQAKKRSAAKRGRKDDASAEDPAECPDGDSAGQEAPQQKRMRDIIKDAKSQISASKASRARGSKEQAEPKSPKSPGDGSGQTAEETGTPDKSSTADPRSVGPGEDSRGKFAPQVQVINGKIVIDEESLVVDASDDADTSKFEEVHETNSYVNAMSFRKTVTPTDRWGASDTALFFKALRLFGADFSMMEKVFPNRTRRQIRNKFKKEEREHKEDIDDILNNKRPLDTATTKALMAELQSKCPKSQAVTPALPSSHDGRPATIAPPVRAPTKKPPLKPPTSLATAEAISKSTASKESTTAAQPIQESALLHATESVCENQGANEEPMEEEMTVHSLMNYEDYDDDEDTYDDAW